MGVTIMVASTSIAATLLAKQTIGPEDYRVSEVNIENFVGALNISVTSADVVSVKIEGKDRYLKDIEVFVSDNKLFIRRDVDFRDWSDGIFRNWTDGVSRMVNDLPVAEVSVPEGTSLHLNGIAGKLDIGDLNGPLELFGWWLEGSIGDVTEAAISVLGNGSIKMSNIAGKLDLEVRGSGDVQVLSAGSADVESAGSGDVRIAEVMHGLEYGSQGSGDATIGSVNGPVTVSVLGSGDVDIREGIADPLDVSIMGSADFTFGGTAHHSHISQLGSGRVRIAHDSFADQDLADLPG